MSSGDFVSGVNGPSALRLVHIYPHLLGTYGDAGNVLVLRHRASERGIPATVIQVMPGQPVPRDADIYLLGGGEDAKQTAAAQELRQDGGLVVAATRGAVVLGVCAGYQLLGEVFPGVGGVATAGLGLLDVRAERMPQRAVGNVLVRSSEEPVLEDSVELGREDLIGFENHGGGSILGTYATALGRVEVGVGNGLGSATEGAVQSRVLGTYLHGPVLALNPGLADWLLELVLGPLAPVDDQLCDNVRRHRLTQVIPATERVSKRRSLLASLGRAQAAPSGAAASLGGEVPGRGADL